MGFMEETGRTLVILGSLLLLGLATDAIGHRSRLPRVTLLLIFGFIVGPGVLDFISPTDSQWFSVVGDMALVMIGFLLGEKLTVSSLRKIGKFVIWISIAEVIITAIAVMAGLLLIGVRIDIAFLLAGIATATAPAATAAVVHEMRANGRFTRTLLGIVAVDDAWGLIVFSIMFTASEIVGGQGNAIALLLTSTWEIGGALSVGLFLGIPMAYLTGRLQPGEPTLVEALGGVFLCGGIAIWLKVSYLLASMALGCVVANMARHHTRPFHAIENIEWPFMILFFVLAGASFHLQALYHIGLVGTVYIICRTIGRFLGAWAGGVISHSDPLMRRWMGMALIPQAGVALGMALVVTHRRPDLGETILPIVIAATVIFELIGPVLTRWAIVRAGEDRSGLSDEYNK